MAPARSPRNLLMACPQAHLKDLAGQTETTQIWACCKAQNYPVEIFHEITIEVVSTKNRKEPFDGLLCLSEKM